MSLEPSSDPSEEQRPRQYTSFAVMFRTSSRGFIQILTADQARGWNPEEVWIFGIPVTPAERALSDAIQPTRAFLSPEAVHLIQTSIHFPNARFLRRTTGYPVLEEYVFDERENLP